MFINSIVPVSTTITPGEIFKSGHGPVIAAPAVPRDAADAKATAARLNRESAVRRRTADQAHVDRQREIDHATAAARRTATRASILANARPRLHGPSTSGSSGRTSAPSDSARTVEARRLAEAMGWREAPGAPARPAATTHAPTLINITDLYRQRNAPVISANAAAPPAPSRPRGFGDVAASYYHDAGAPAGTALIGTSSRGGGR